MTIDNTPARGRFEAARELAFGDITSSFQAIGTPFGVSFYAIFVQNQTDVLIDFSVSYAGTDTTFTLAPGGTFSGDMRTNDVIIAAGESAWCKYRDGAPTSGFVQVSSVEPSVS